VTPEPAFGARLRGVLEAIGPLDAAAMAAAAARLDRLTKPPGSLGRLEALAIQLAGIRGEPAPPLDRRTIVVVAADHGVAARGVSAYPSAVTRQMVANFVAGGAAISVLAARASASVVVLDVGVAGPEPMVAERATEPAAEAAEPSAAPARLLVRRVRPGTRDLVAEPAMSPGEARAAIEIGLDLAAELVAGGADVVGLGEMGIGNTTSASAVTAALTGRAPAEVTGRGTGVDDARLAAKIRLIERALDRARCSPDDPFGVLCELGGLELAGLVGLALGVAAAGRPVLLDGFITGAAALVAARLAPDLPRRLLAAHRSVEPGHRVILDGLGLAPILDLDLRLGEGTGAALALHMLDAAVAVRDRMATFEEAGVAAAEAGAGAASR
jgi:nicotinate-nucleotide--dimethylbenzimidazole phosphoribosyltransferase